VSADEHYVDRWSLNKLVCAICKKHVPRSDHTVKPAKKITSTWESCKSYEFRRPYNDGHMFLAIYMRELGYTYRAIGNAIGVSAGRADQIVKKARRIISSVDLHGYSHQRRAKQERIRQSIITRGVTNDQQKDGA
jgi:hypothetical protein